MSRDSARVVGILVEPWFELSLVLDTVVSFLCENRIIRDRGPLKMSEGDQATEEDKVEKKKKHDAESAADLEKVTGEI